MVDQALLSYIIEQEHAGYSEEQIKKALAANNYDSATIKAAFKELQPRQDSIVQEYVAGYAKQGYTPAQTFKFLHDQQYSAGTIRKALKEVYGIKENHTLLTVTFILIALCVGAGGMYFILADSQVDPLPEYPGAVLSLSPSEIISQVVEGTRKQGDSYGIRECETRLTGRNRDLCFQTIAVEVQDTTICKKIIDASIHDACWMNFLASDFSAVCVQVKLADTQKTCSDLKALGYTGA